MRLFSHLPRVRTAATFLIREHAVSLVVLALLSVLGAALNFVYPFLTQQVVDRLISNPKSVDVVFLCAALMGLGVGSLVFELSNKVVSGRLGVHITEWTRTVAFQSVLAKPADFFRDVNSGDVVQRIHGETGALRTLLVTKLPNLAVRILTVVVGMGVLWWMSWQMTLVLLLSLPVLAVASQMAGAHMKVLTRKKKEQYAEATGVLKEGIDGIEGVKLYLMEEWFGDRYAKRIDRAGDESLRLVWTRAFLHGGVGIINQGVMVGVIGTGIWLMQQSQLTWGELTAYMMYVGVVGNGVSSLLSTWTQLQAKMAVLERLEVLLEEDVILGTPRPRPSLRDESQLTMQEIEVGFGGDPSLYDSLALTVSKGRLTALAGPSGSGKSSLWRVLAKLHTVRGGSVCIGEDDLHDLDPRQARAACTIVPQDPPIWTGTVSENLALHGPIDTDWRDEVLDALHLRERLNALPDGLDTVLEEAGEILSGGERQRLALTRGLLRNTGLLVLDEPTTWLDSQAREGLFRLLERVRQTRGVLVISHDPELLAACDDVVHLNTPRRAPARASA